MSLTQHSDAESDEVEERPWRQLLRHKGRDPCAHGQNPQDARASQLSLTPHRHAIVYRRAGPQLTVRATLTGLAVGTLLCFTNMYFGLQTGWVTMGSIQCALLGYGILRPYRNDPRRPFGPLENVVVQTIGVATATLPLAGGFIGIIPALGMLDPPVVLSMGEQLAWGAALTYFGIFFAVPLRRQTILVEKLAFPSGTATAKLIDTLHGGVHGRYGGPTSAALEEEAESEEYSLGSSTQGEGPWRALGLAFAASFGTAAFCTFGFRDVSDPALHVFRRDSFRDSFRVLPIPSF